MSFGLPPRPATVELEKLPVLTVGDKDIGICGHPDCLAVAAKLGLLCCCFGGQKSLVIAPLSHLPPGVLEPLSLLFDVWPHAAVAEAEAEVTSASIEDSHRSAAAVADPGSRKRKQEHDRCAKTQSQVDDGLLITRDVIMQHGIELLRAFSQSDGSSHS